MCAILKPLALCSPVSLSPPRKLHTKNLLCGPGEPFSLSGTQHALLARWPQRPPRPWDFENPLCPARPRG